MNNHRNHDQFSPRELLNRSLELVIMLYFGQGDRMQLQLDLSELMSQAKLMGLTKAREDNDRSVRPVETIAK